MIQELLKELTDLTLNDMVSIATIIAAIVPVLISILGVFIKNLKSCIERNIYLPQIHTEYNLFYLWILGYSIVVGFLLIPFYGFFLVILKWPFVADVVVPIVFMYVAVKFINGRTWVRKRLLEKYRKIYVLLVDAPVVVFVIISCCVCSGERHLGIINVLMWIYVLCEGIGLCVFRGRYRIYVNSFARMKLKSGELIENIPTPTIRKAFSWLIIRKNDIERKVSIDDISYLEYYGNPIYVVEKNCINKMIVGIGKIKSNEGFWVKRK